MWRSTRIIILVSLSLAWSSNAAEQIETIQLMIAPEAIRTLERSPKTDVPVVAHLRSGSVTNSTVHLKGRGSFQPISSKASFSIRCPEAKLFGRKKLLLNNSSQDRSFLKWKIASELFTKAGVPSPAVSFARVSLNGKKPDLYLMLEPTDKKFLQKHFRDATGNLYEGDNQDVTDPLDKDNGAKGDEQPDREKLAAACLEASLQARWSKLNEVLDVDRFLKFMATEVLIDHRDGYSMDRNNFRLYHDPASDKFVFLPHGLDLIFYSRDLSPSRGFSSVLARTLLEIPEGKASYENQIRMLAREFYGDETVLTRVDELWNEIKNDAPAESYEAVTELKRALKARIAVVQAGATGKTPKL
jgi:spore coat protein H